MAELPQQPRPTGQLPINARAALRLSRPRRVFACAAIAAGVLIAGCGSGSSAGASATAIARINITERDFHIGLSASTVQAGTVTLHIHNAGPDEHELIVAPRRAACGCERTASPMNEAAIVLLRAPARSTRSCPRERNRDVRPRPGPLRALLQHGGPLHGRHAHGARGAADAAAFEGATSARSPVPSRRTIVGIFATFALSVGCDGGAWIAATSRSQNWATVVEIAGRQRTLAEQYVQEVLLVRAGEKADPAVTASTMEATATRAPRRRHGAGRQGDDDAPPSSAARPGR